MARKLDIIAVTIPSEEKSVKRLGFNTRVNIYERIEEFYARNPYAVVIRFGNSVKLNNRNFKPEEFGYVVNHADKIAENCDKRGSLARLSSVVLTPRVYTGKVNVNKLLVIRPNSHSSGSGFRVQKGPVVLDNNHHALEYIKSKTELRVWFCGNSCVTAKRISEKHKNDKFPCRSKWGYLFRKTNPTLRRQVLKAAKVLDLQFGAFDIIVKDNKFYFLENNSAPTFDNKKIIKFYKSNLIKLVNKKFPKITKYKKEQFISLSSIFGSLKPSIINSLKNLGVKVNG